MSAGLDPATLLEVFNAGSGRNTATSQKFPEHVLTRRFASGFRLELMAKDVELCVAEARDRGFPMLVGGLVQQIWTLAASQAAADADHTEIVAAVRGLGGRRDRGERGDRRWPVLTARAATRSMPCATGRSDRARRTSSTATGATASPTSRSRWRTTSGCCATAGETIVVDCGFDPEVGARRGRTCLCAPLEALRALGVEPESVSTVVVTHLHYDHIGNLAAFPAATLIVPRRELDFWTGPIAARFQFALARRAARDRARRAGGRRWSRAADRRDRGDPRRRHRDRGRRPLRRASR